MSSLQHDYNKQLSVYIIEAFDLEVDPQEVQDVLDDFKYREDESQIKKCQYIPSRGKFKGIMCGKKAEHNINGGWYCGKVKHENDEVLYSGHARSAHLQSLSTKKTTTTTISSLLQRKEQKDKKSQSMVERLINIKKEFVVKTNKFGNKWNEETRLVFHPSTNVVLGKQKDDGEIGVLDHTAIKLCEKHNWHFDQNNVAHHLRDRIIELEEDSDDDYVLD